ncbi:ThuA domain-containing protein [Planctomicrobium sp. SH661]|uniref:ThuA domain-containing protein n=1 Tax=Planctomicrobium sp. SH661 TaxID=3448124 RepID=UPI003F5AFEBC
MLLSSEGEATEPLRVCILSGCPTYHSEKSLPDFQKYLEENFHVKCTRLVRKDTDDLPGLESLENCDVCFVFIKRMQLKGDQLRRFQDYMTSGKPIVAVRTASHAVQTWLDFDREVLGGNYQGHHAVGPEVKVSVTSDGQDHPVLAGVDLTTVQDALYKNNGHADDIHVLLRGEIDGQPVEPLAWTRDVNGGRVFYTSLGAEETFQRPEFRKMLANALFWTAGRLPESKQ